MCLFIRTLLLRTYWLLSFSIFGWILIKMSLPLPLPIYLSLYPSTIDTYIPICPPTRESWNRNVTLASAVILRKDGNKILVIV